jgi:hypothetical protein
MPIDWFEIGLGWRHLYIVFDRRVECATTTDAEVNACGRNQRLDPRLYQSWWRRRSGGRDLTRQAVALIGVEDREALQEMNGLSLLATLVRPPFFLGRDEAVGINHRRSTLALAYVATKRQRLTEREPALARESLLDHGAPKDQHVDAAIRPAGFGVFRHRQRRFRCCRSPWLNPGQTSGFEFSHDLGGDFVVKIRPAHAGMRFWMMWGHRGAPRQALQASLAARNLSRPNRVRTLTLYIDACGNDRDPKGGDALAAPLAGVCLRVERDRPRAGHALTAVTAVLPPRQQRRRPRMLRGCHETASAKRPSFLRRPVGTFLN